MNLPKTADFVVIGGGVMGASTAYHLAKRGFSNVLLLEKEEFFGQGATGRCAGGVRYQFGTGINIKLSLASLPMLESFEEETGQPIDYRQLGYLFLLTDENDVDVFKRNVELQHSLGVQTEWLTGNQIRARLPFMNLDDVVAGTNHHKDGVVDPNSVVMGYINSAKKIGVNAVNDVNVTGITVQSGKITGVETNQGTISTPVVVNATGPWAGMVSKLAGVDIPLVPLRRQWITTTSLPDLPDDFPFVIDFSKSLYFHLEGEGVLTGMSNPDEKPGFSQNIDPDWELVHMEAAVQRLPMLETAGLSSRQAGLYENTPDAHPIYGKTPVEGLYIVTGFSGHGFMHGPVSGKLMTEIIIDGKSSTVDVSSLSLSRFEKGETIAEYNVI